MASSTSLHSERETLMSIHHIASSIAKDFSAYRLGTHPPDFSDTSIPTLDLSFPPDILSPILSLPIPYDVRQQIIQRFTRLITELQQEYNNSYKEACLVRANVFGFDRDLGSVHRLYLGRFKQRCFPLVQSQISSVLAQVASYQQLSWDGGKKPFNTEYIPVLEKYFELNGYPSSAHRSILAQKSGMTPRQIEVWFQNHRKRSKQDGKIVRRLDSDVPLRRALSILPQTSRSYPIRLETPDDGTISEDFTTQPPGPTSVLEETEEHKIRPPHAFPKTRSSRYDDPFPNDNGIFRFPPPIWKRKPATTPIIPIAVDMDELARLFHMKLNFVNGPWKRESTPSKSDGPSFTPWFAPSRTIPPSAPLSSLIRTPASSLVSSSIMSPLAMDPLIFDFGTSSQRPGISCVVRLPFGPQKSDSSIAKSFMLPDEASRQEVAPACPTLSISPSVPPGEVCRRKVLPMPRRTPSTVQSFGSRTSSFSSDTSYSSDDSSPSPSTPPPLPNQDLILDPLLESYEATLNLDNYLDLSSWTSNPSRTFDFCDKPTQDEQASSLFQNFTPLVSTC